MTPDRAPADSVPEVWRCLVYDAAVFPPGNAPLHEATAAYAERAGAAADLVASFVLRDTDLPLVRGFTGPLSVVVTGGAGQLAGPVALCGRLGLRLAGREIALRDLDDLAGNVRRVDASVRAAGIDVPVHIEIPGPATVGWLAAADEVAAGGHRLKFRLGHVDHDLVPDPSTVAAWIDAALDRETPFKGTAGLHRAVRHEPEGGGAHGFLNVMVATATLWDGGSVDDAVDALEQRDGATLVAVDLGNVRRWFTSFGSCSVTDPLDDLAGLGLLSPDRTEQP